MDSQDLPGVVLCPDRPHDDKILLFFLKYWSKMAILTKMAQTAKMVYFCYFFPLNFFLYLWGVSPIEHPQTTPQNHL